MIEKFLTEPEEKYKNILKDILANGTRKSNRTGTDTLSIFNTQWDSGKLLGNGYIPVMTCRKTYFKGAIVELFWILGILQKQNPILFMNRNNIAYLKREGCNYWDKWADKNGDLGPVYGAQLTEWKYDYFTSPIRPFEFSFDNTYIYNKTLNQVEKLIETLRTNPDDRRMICTMWNPGELHLMALPPCHYCFECYSRPLDDGSRELDLRWIQRSCDMPLGVPYDIIMYSLLLMMLCKLTNHKPGKVIGLFGDSHIYVDQIDGVKESLEAPDICPPRLEYTGPEYVEDLYDFKMDWFKIVDYNYYKEIKLPVSV